MNLEDIDKSELILESYRIDGIRPEECRSIFLDWALKLPGSVDQRQAIELMIATYASDAPDHPMSKVLQEGLGLSPTPGRRGGRKARLQNPN